MREYSRSNPRKINAGSVKITPEAIDWPALPVVCTMLFSRIDARPNARRILIDSTEIGIEAATVSPAFRPTYTVTAPKMMPKRDPSSRARKVNSGRFSEGETKGSNSATKDPPGVGKQIQSNFLKGRV
jgi:hypothetical protein